MRKTIHRVSKNCSKVLKVDQTWGYLIGDHLYKVQTIQTIPHYFLEGNFISMGHFTDCCHRGDALPAPATPVDPSALPAAIINSLYSDQSAVTIVFLAFGYVSYIYRNINIKSVNIFIVDHYVNCK